MGRKSRFSPHSQRPLFVDYLPAEGARCGSCDSPLKVPGAATYFFVDGEAVPFGFYCAKTRAVSDVSKEEIPNLTKGAVWAESGGGTSGSSAPAETCDLGLITDTERVAALEYGFLRLMRLPALGIFELSALNVLRQGLDCANRLVASHIAGTSDPDALAQTIKAMKKAEEKQTFQHMSLGNMRACYVVGQLLLDIKRTKGYLPTADYWSWRGVKEKLGTTLVLDETDCAMVDRLAARYSPHSPRRSHRLVFRGTGVTYHQK